MPEQCRWTFCGDKREGDIPPGNLSVIRPCNDGINDFEVHGSSADYLYDPGSILVSQEGGLPRDKAVSITDQELDVLLGVDDVKLDSSFIS